MEVRGGWDIWGWGRREVEDEPDLLVGMLRSVYFVVLVRLNVEFLIACFSSSSKGGPFSFCVLIINLLQRNLARRAILGLDGSLHHARSQKLTHTKKFRAQGSGQTASCPWSWLRDEWRLGLFKRRKGSCKELQLTSNDGTTDTTSILSVMGLDAPMRK